MDSRVPPALQPMLVDYLSRLQKRLPGLLAACYLHGSVAYGDDDVASDVDCLALLNRRCTPDDLATLREIHRQVDAARPGARLEVSYVQWSDRGLRGVAAPPHPFHHDGVLHEDDSLDPNSPFRLAIGWWQVKQRGIALLGPEVSTLDLAVSASDLLADSLALVETHWSAWARSPRLLASLRHAKSVDWAVLGILRTYYTIREQDVATKAVAAGYGVSHLPERWHRLIRETLQARRQPAERGLVFRLRTAIESALFLRFMVAECRRLGAASATGFALYSRSRRT